MAGTRLRIKRTGSDAVSVPGIQLAAMTGTDTATGSVL